MAGADCLSGGQLNAAVTTALVGIQTEHLGRGLATASTFHHASPRVVVYTVCQLVKQQITAGLAITQIHLAVQDVQGRDRAPVIAFPEGAARKLLTGR
jgi:hypothetical protein